MVLPKHANLVRAAAIALIVYGMFYSIGALTGAISDILYPSGLGTLVLLGGFACVLEAAAIILAGFLILARPDFITVAALIWFLGTLLKTTYFLWRATGFDATLENFGYVVVLLSPALGLSILVVLLRGLRKTELETPSCLKCNYSLRGLTEPRCPECGRAYTLDEFYDL